MSVVQNVIKFNSHTQARDKFYRIFQYGAKLLIWHLTRSESGHTTFFQKLMRSGSGHAAFIQKLKYLEDALSVSRKLFRMGNSMELFQKALAATAIRQQDLMALTFSASFFKAVWLAIDHALWFGKINVIQIDLPYWMQLSLRAWLVALLCAVILDLRKIKSLNQKMAKAQKKESVSKLEGSRAELQACQLTLVRDFCDVAIPLSGLGYAGPGWGAIGGVISSIVGFHQEWKKHITLQV